MKLGEKAVTTVIRCHNTDSEGDAKLNATTPKRNEAQDDSKPEDVISANVPATEARHEHAEAK